LNPKHLYPIFLKEGGRYSQLFPFASTLYFRLINLHQPLPNDKSSDNCSLSTTRDSIGETRSTKAYYLHTIVPCGDRHFRSVYSDNKQASCSYFSDATAFVFSSSSLLHWRPVISLILSGELLVSK
jgi:hypothetical protein